MSFAVAVVEKRYKVINQLKAIKMRDKAPQIALN